MLIQQHIFSVECKPTPFRLDSFDRRTIHIMTMYTLDKDTIMPFILIYDYISIKTDFNIYRARDTPTKILQIGLLSMHSCQHCGLQGVCALLFPVLPCPSLFHVIDSRGTEAQCGIGQYLSVKHLFSSTDGSQTGSQTLKQM